MAARLFWWIVEGLFLLFLFAGVLAVGVLLALLGRLETHSWVAAIPGAAVGLFVGYEFSSVVAYPVCMWLRAKQDTA